MWPEVGLLCGRPRRGGAFFPLSFRMVEVGCWFAMASKTLRAASSERTGQ